MQGITILFQINYHCYYGDSLYICGSIDELGNWDPKKGFRLQWTPGDTWVGEFIIPKKQCKFFEYKFLVESTDITVFCQNMKWEENEDRCLMLKGKSFIEINESWGLKTLTKMMKLTEDVIENKLDQISKESIKVEEVLDHQNQKQLSSSVKQYEQRNLAEIFSQQDDGWCSDFHQIIPLLLYIYHTKVTAIQLLDSIQVSSSYMKEFLGILKTLVQKLKQILFTLLETLKSSETCVVSIETEFSKLIKLRNFGSQYSENFKNNIFIIYLMAAINSLVICMKKDNFSLVEDNLKAKIIEVTSGVSSIKDSIQHLENLYKKKKSVEKEIFQSKKKCSRLQLSLDLIHVCKNYYLSITNNNRNEIIDNENRLRLILQEVLGKNTFNTTNFYNIMGQINCTLFEKYRKIVTHEECHQKIVYGLNFTSAYDLNDYNNLYSFLDQSYTEMMEAAQNEAVYMKFRNNADRALLFFFSQLYVIALCNSA